MHLSMHRDYLTEYDNLFDLYFEAFFVVVVLCVEKSICIRSLINFPTAWRQLRATNEYTTHVIIFLTCVCFANFLFANSNCVQCCFFCIFFFFLDSPPSVRTLFALKLNIYFSVSWLFQRKLLCVQSIGFMNTFFFLCFGFNKPLWVMEPMANILKL